VELELVSTGERWGRGPKHDVHSSLEATVDSPTWHLVQALNRLIKADGHTPAVEGFFEKAKPLTDEQKEMIAAYAARTSEATIKKTLGVEHWVRDVSWLESRMLLESQPTINIEGLVAATTGPGGKTVLPHRANGQDRHASGAGHDRFRHAGEIEGALEQQGFGDIEVNMSGGYDPNQTDQKQSPHPSAARDHTAA